MKRKGKRLIGKGESDRLRTMAFAGLSQAAGAGLQALPILSLDRDVVLFRPGDQAQGFVPVLSGRIKELLTGLAGTCPLCSLFGLSTCPLRRG